MAYQQVFIDCMPGPTYHFGGHSYGNIASMNSANKPSNPKKAALEWINKIKMIKSIGSKQIILPPHRRPLYGYKKSPNLHHLSSAYTWMANSGHFTASCDTKDNSPIFTPSNMNQTNHRLKEHYFNRYWINKIFKNKIKCTKPFHSDDEGAANTIRLSNQSLSLGLNIYVYGNKESHYPCRQSKKSIESLIKTHRIHNYFTLKQSKRAIDAGIFHNDVISFGFKNFLFCHKEAFEDQKSQLDILQNQYEDIFHCPLIIIEVDEIELETAVSTYIFNSQVISHKNRDYLLCPLGVKENKQTQLLVNKWKKLGFFNDVIFVSLKQSLMNGGGPGCMRLTLLLNEDEIQNIPSNYFCSFKTLSKLESIIKSNFPESFNINTFNLKNSKEIESMIETLILEKNRI